MQHYSDTVLYKTHQHFIVVIVHFCSRFFLFALLTFLVGKYMLQWSPAVFLWVLLLWAVVIFWLRYFFWVKSYFIISNEKIIIKVRNTLFSKFHMSIHYKNIRDTAFSKNHILHYMLGYGTFFARSSAGAVGDLVAPSIPRIEKVYKIINTLHNFSDEERKQIRNLEDIQNPPLSGHSSVPLNKGEDETQWSRGIVEILQEATQKEKQILLNIQWIKEVVVLSDTDRRYIFEHEEDRNHGVYECLRRQNLMKL